jgi:hypothetical protein
MTPQSWWSSVAGIADHVWSIEETSACSNRLDKEGSDPVDRKGSGVRRIESCAPRTTPTA